MSWLPQCSKPAYIALGALTLARRGLLGLGWRGRAWVFVVLLWFCSWLGLRSEYHVSVTWGRHRLLVGTPVSPPGGATGEMQRTVSGDFVWVPSSR
jgi:hypothetical protein